MERKKTADQTPNNDKKQALDTAIRQIEKNFGKGAVMRLGDRPDLQVDAIPTGSLALDAALGIGGVPKGRIIEIYGPESSGKTTLALHIVAQAQKRGGEVAFVDAEHALDPDYAARIGVDIDSMLVSQPDTGEQALEITDALVRSGAVDVVVVDSVAALTPRAEIEGEMGDTFVGLQARLMSQALRKLAGNISKTNCVVIFINQLRMKIGVMYGNPETTTGGNALKFYSSVRLDVRKIEAIKSGTEFVERGELTGPALERCLAARLAPVLAAGPDALVLGCTHFPFAAGAIRRVVGPDVELLDGSAGTARETKRRLLDAGLLVQQGEGSVTIENSLDSPAILALSRQLLHAPIFPGRESFDK